ncbi:MAG: N-acetyl sugar amidotransferase [Bacteroidales bacterium]|nr:N-acetyl sugar amidotransferase [Bacteroidales bacterium]
MKRKYQICEKCAMDTTDPEIVFDENGICNYCKSYPERMQMFGSTADEKSIYLREMIEFCKEKGKGKNHDCIIGVSGGVDSTYVAYKIKEFGLRPLAIHLDNGWDAELAVSNIRNVLKKLDIDLYTYVLDWEEFRSLQLAFLKASTPDSEIPTDHAIVALLKSFAVKEKIPLIWGVNFSSEAILPRVWSQGHMDWGYIKKINSLFGEKKLKDFPHYSVFKRIYWNRIKRIKIFSLLDYIDYDKEKAKKFLIEELGWRDYGGKHHESIYTKFFQAYILPTKFGFDKRRAHLSSLILAGQMTREEALIEIKKPLYDEKELQEHLIYVPKKLGLTREKFEEILNASPRRYEDFSPSLPKFIYEFEEKCFRVIIKIKKKIISEKN